MWKRALVIVAACGFAVGMATVGPARAQSGDGTQVEYANGDGSTSIRAYGEYVAIPIEITLTALS
jgi:hypothetical protein